MMGRCEAMAQCESSQSLRVILWGSKGFREDLFPGQSCGTGRTGEWKGLSRKSHASFTKFFEFSEKLQAKARRNLINASKLSTLRVWISRGFWGMLHRYPDVFFSIYHPKGCGGRDVSSSLYCYISYIISTCFSATFPIQLHVASTQYRRVPHLGDLHTGKPKLCPADGRDIPF